MGNSSFVERLGSGAGPVSAWLAFVVGEAVLVGLVFVQTHVAQSVNPPTCHGIGWGCTPDAGTTAMLFAVFIGVPALVVATAFIVAGAAVGRRSPRAGGTTILLPLVLLVVAMTALLADIAASLL